jgi:integrase
MDTLHACIDPVRNTPRRRGQRVALDGKPRSLHREEWTKIDQEAWATVFRPRLRLTPGGGGRRLAPVSRDDYANRYGLYLDFLKRTGRLDIQAGASELVTPAWVADYRAELQGRQRSGTMWNSIYKLRRAAELLAPKVDFSWLREIENDLALIIVPKSKVNRWVATPRLVKAGLTLIAEAETFARTDRARAIGVRNGLMIAILALYAIRLKNFASLAIEATFVNVDGNWWIRLPRGITKSRKADNRRVPDDVNDFVDRYINRYRPMLVRPGRETNALWISSTTGLQYTAKNLGILISRITRETLGVDVSPHLFRTSLASTAAVRGGKFSYLASELLQHSDHRVTQEHYNRATSMSAAQDYALITEKYRRK